MADRDPSLHIRRSDLMKVISEMSFTGRVYSHKVVDEIFDKSQKFQIKDRYLSVINAKAKTRKKMERSMAVDSELPESTVEIFNRILTGIRQKSSKHVKVKPILKSSKDYLMLKEVAKQAWDFLQKYEIKDLEEGFTEYLEIGMGMMRKYALNRFKYYDNKIHEYFDDKLIVLQDTDRNKTLEFYYIWRDFMVEYGLEELIDIEHNYQKFSHIVLGRQDADKRKADYSEWVEAQFDGLAFLDAVPELSQFYGDGAEKRYESFIRKAIEIEDVEKSSITKYYK